MSGVVHTDGGKNSSLFFVSAVMSEDLRHFAGIQWKGIKSHVYTHVHKILQKKIIGFLVLRNLFTDGGCMLRIGGEGRRGTLPRLRPSDLLRLPASTLGEGNLLGRELAMLLLHIDHVNTMQCMVKGRDCAWQFAKDTPYCILSKVGKGGGGGCRGGPLRQPLRHFMLGWGGGRNSGHFLLKRVPWDKGVA